MVAPARGVAVVLCTVLIVAGFSGSTARAIGTMGAHPAGPSAELSPSTGGNGVFIGEPIAVNLKRAGYGQDEYVASGTASSYTATGTLTGDGRWSFAPDGSAPYRTRVLVRRPRDRARFSGTVVVEWLNVSGASCRSECIRGTWEAWGLMTNLMTRDDQLRYSNSVRHGAQAISQRLPSGSEK